MFTTLNLIRDRLLAPTPPPVAYSPSGKRLLKVEIPEPDEGITYLTDEPVKPGEITYVENPLGVVYSPDVATRQVVMRRYRCSKVSTAAEHNARLDQQARLEQQVKPVAAKILTDDDIKTIRQRQKTDHFTLSLFGRKPTPDRVNLELMFTDATGTFTKWIAQYTDNNPCYQAAKELPQNDLTNDLLLAILIRMHYRFADKQSHWGQAWLLPVVNWFCAPPTLDLGLPWHHEAFDPEVNIASHLDNTLLTSTNWRAMLREVIVDLGINQLPPAHGMHRWCKV